MIVLIVNKIIFPSQDRSTKATLYDCVLKSTSHRKPEMEVHNVTSRRCFSSSVYKLCSIGAKCFTLDRTQTLVRNRTVLQVWSRLHLLITMFEIVQSFEGIFFHRNSNGCRLHGKRPWSNSLSGAALKRCQVERKRAFAYSYDITQSKSHHTPQIS